MFIALYSRQLCSWAGYRRPIKISLVIFFKCYRKVDRVVLTFCITTMRKFQVHVGFFFANCSLSYQFHTRIHCGGDVVVQHQYPTFGFDGVGSKELFRKHQNERRYLETFIPLICKCTDGEAEIYLSPSDVRTHSNEIVRLKLSWNFPPGHSFANCNR